jgi:RNA-directed DNA polymerase
MTHAIRSLAAQYPKLADINSSTGKISIKFRRFKYTGNSTGRILGIGGGSGYFGRFIATYKADIGRFKAPGLQWPIILLIDNDSGREPIFNTIKSITGRRPDASDPYVHIFGNLYLVTTPLLGGTQQSKIEDCFDDATKNTVLAGKTFNPENEYNTTTHYGKADFAYNVVKLRADRIDFTGFKPIFDRFVSVLDEHAHRCGHPTGP